MKPTRDLFDLVKSLAKNEKRYVSLYLSAGLHGSNKSSLRLFRALSKQETYDDALLKKQVGKAVAARFSSEKNKLFDLILESMLLYYRDSTVERKLARMRFQASFLFQKKLQSLGWRHLRKAIALSEADEVFTMRLQLAYMENLETRRSSDAAAHAQPETYPARDEKILQVLHDDLTLHTLYTRMIDLERRYGSISGSQEAAALVNAVMQHPLMDPARKLDAFTSQISRLETRAVCCTMSGDTRKAYECLQEQVALYEKDPAHIGQNYGRYCDALQNHLMYAVQLGEYDTFEKLLPKVRAAVEGVKKYVSYDTDYLDFIALQLLELTVYKNKADTDRGPAFLVQVEKRFRQYRPRMREAKQLEFLYHIGTYHFYLGDLKKALAFYNEIIDSGSNETAQHVQDMLRLVKLLLHFDLGHAELLDSLGQSAKRLLGKHGRLGDFEKMLLAFFRSAAGGKSKAAFRELHAGIRKLAPGIYGYTADCGFHFEAWAEGRSRDQPLHLLVAKSRS